MPAFTCPQCGSKLPVWKTLFVSQLWDIKCDRCNASLRADYRSIEEILSILGIDFVSFLIALLAFYWLRLELIGGVIVFCVFFILGCMLVYPFVIRLRVMKP